MPEFTPGNPFVISSGATPFSNTDTATTPDGSPSSYKGGSFDPDSGVFHGRSRTPATSESAARPALMGSGALAFTRNGSHVLSREAGSSDVVNLGGQIGETTVGAALANGWLVENPGGGFERVGQVEAVEPEVAQRTQAEDLTPSPFTSDVAENVVGQLQQFEGYAPAVDTVISGGELKIEDVARELKCSEEQAEQAVQITRQAFSQQFDAHVASYGVNGSHLAQWVQDHAPAEVKELHVRAMKDHTGSRRSLKGYQPVVGEYIAAMAENFGPALVKQNAKYLSMANDGTTVLVDLPELGQTPLRVAARQGWLFRK